MHKADTANGIDCSSTQPTSAYNCDAHGAIGVGADNGVSGGGGGGLDGGGNYQGASSRSSVGMARAAW